MQSVPVLFIFLMAGTLSFAGSNVDPAWDESTSSSQPGSQKPTNGPLHSELSTNVVGSPSLTLKLAFMADPRLFPYDIECHVQEKSVELKGTVSREDEKAFAELLTKNLMEGKKIISHIDVQPSFSANRQKVLDSRLTDLVRERFSKSQTLREADFEIVTIRGVVSLSGRTRFQVIALEAAQTAREIPGVIAVRTDNVRLEAKND